MSYAILIVDDSKVIRSVVRKSLEMSGLAVGEVHEAGNGLEALAVLSGAWIDIVFADLNMPEMGGVEMVEKMAEHDVLANIPVVVVSSDRSEVRQRRLRDLGIKAYLRKPFRPESLRDVVTDILGPTGDGK